MKNERRNIVHFCFSFFNLKIFSEIVPFIFNTRVVFAVISYDAVISLSIIHSAVNDNHAYWCSGA